MNALGIQSQAPQAKPVVELIRVNGNQLVPSYATPGSAAVDLRSNLSWVLTLKPGATHALETGILININNPSLVAMILPRSGLGFNEGLVLGNLTGVIDSDYQGQVIVGLWNRGTKDIIIEPGMRVAQLVFVRCEQVEFSDVNKFSSTTQRGTGGFGSTGKI